MHVGAPIYAEMYVDNSTSSFRSVKIALLSHTPKQAQVNLETALPVVVRHIKGGWDSIQSLHIKTSTSVSLPIWTCDLGSGEGGRWDGLVAEDIAKGVEKGASENSDEDEEEEEEEPVKPKKVVVSGKGTKRQLEDKTEQPKERPKRSRAK